MLEIECKQAGNRGLDRRLLLLLLLLSGVVCVCVGDDEEKRPNGQSLLSP